MGPTRRRPVRPQPWPRAGVAALPVPPAVRPDFGLVAPRPGPTGPICVSARPPIAARRRWSLAATPTP
ncbi:hypothetical protein DMC47_24420 [Nostoc sp. 3335mG]|nr:hypothetical protein DMC47_24420 [Nostoc sp. 3335mG]